MTDLKVFLTSDLHLGITTWGKINPLTGVNTMVEKFVKELELTLDRAIKLKIKIWIIAGDVTHTRTPSNYVRHAFVKVIERARQNGIFVYVMLGNHDQLVSLGTKNNLSELAEIKLDNLRVVEQSDFVEKFGLQIAFLPWQAKTEDIIRDAKEIIRELDESKPAILIGHFTVAGAEVGTEKLFELYGDTTVPIEEIKSPKIQFTFLGHIHKRQMLKKLGRVMYIGSMERVDFSDGGEEKGSTLFTINTETKEFDIEFIEGTPQKFVQFELDLKKTKLETVDFSPADGAIVKLKLKCTQEQKKKIDYEMLQVKLAKAVHVVETFDIQKDGERKEDKRFVKDLPVTEALKLWLEKQDITEEMREKVLKEGQKILQEDLI